MHPFSSLSKWAVVQTEELAESSHQKVKQSKIWDKNSNNSCRVRVMIHLKPALLKVSLPSCMGHAAAASIWVANHFFSKIVEVLRTLMGISATWRAELHKMQMKTLQVQLTDNYWLQTAKLSHGFNVIKAGKKKSKSSFWLTCWMYISGAIIGLRRTSLVGVFPMPYPLLWASATLIAFSPSGVKNRTVVALKPASKGCFWN